MKKNQQTAPSLNSFITSQQLRSLDVGLTAKYFEHILGPPPVSRPITFKCGASTFPIQYSRWSDSDYEVQALFKSDNSIYFVIRLLRAEGRNDYSYYGMPWRLYRSSFQELDDEHYGAFETGDAHYQSYTERMYFGKPGKYHQFYFTMNVSEYLPGEKSPGELVAVSKKYEQGQAKSEFHELRSQALPNAVGIGDDDAFSDTCTASLDGKTVSWQKLELWMVSTFAENFEHALRTKKPQIADQKEVGNCYSPVPEVLVIEDYDHSPTYDLGQNRKLFVVTAIGTGVTHQGLETWYLSDGENVSKVLELERWGNEHWAYEEDWGMVNTEFDSRILKAEVEEPDNRFVVEIEYDVSYENNLRDSHPNVTSLFSYTKKAYLVMEPTNGFFEVDMSKSELSCGQMRGILSDGKDGFLKQNVSELKQIAESDDEPKKKWLLDFLKDCKESSEKRQLSDVLQ
ncbi:MAG: hypothetical protein JRJ47_00950 [Deltaproteobacteria bacterium]|nr:hypothetical protein [Deltaproteobacteria bacterium]